MKKKIAILLFLNTLSFQNISPRLSKIFILVGPSGVGKSTLIQKLAQSGIPCDILITHTTRPIRSGEIDKKDYFFINHDEFNEKIKNNEFIHVSTIYGNYYGISKEFLPTKLEAKCDMISALTGDVAKKMKDLFKKQIVTIFITPPTLQELEKRLIQRKSENESSLKIRLASATQELDQQNSFDHKITNDNLEKAVEALLHIVHKEIYK